MFNRTHPRVEILNELPVFRACTSRELEAIARVTDDIEVQAGTILTREGRPGLECFVIVEGEVSVGIGGIEVARLGPGELVGEMSIIDGGLCSATVVALTPMYVIVISRPAFQALLARYPTVARAVLQTLSERVRSLLPDVALAG